MERISNQLLCVTGLTPQVVTETLFALYQAGESMPVGIDILTTAEGAERARLMLLKDQWLQRFYQDYQLTMPTADKINIHKLTDDKGEPLQDIRSQQNNQAMADGITEIIRQRTLNPDQALIVSIAGGRKTMGFYAGYALSLYGRPQDKLTHVLVSADYESHPQFYYPTPHSQVIYANDPTRKPLDAQNAQVTIADIPFLRLRHGLDEELLNGQSSFSESINRAQTSFAPPLLHISLSASLLTVQHRSITLKPTDMAFMQWLIEQQFNEKKALRCPPEGAPNEAYARQYLSVYQRIYGELSVSERTQDALTKGMEKSFFEQHKSAVNAAIKKTLSIHAAPYLIHSRGRRPKTEFILKLEMHQITYQEEE